jgi:hypothetical protein
MNNKEVEKKFGEFYERRQKEIPEDTLKNAEMQTGQNNEIINLTSQLIKSSRNIEKLTKRLAVFTIILLIFTIVLVLFGAWDFIQGLVYYLF